MPAFHCGPLTLSANETAQIGKPVAGILVLAARGVERVIEQRLDLVRVGTELLS
jgi:hypothetical protein